MVVSRQNWDISIVETNFLKLSRFSRPSRLTFFWCREWESRSRPRRDKWRLGEVRCYSKEWQMNLKGTFLERTTLSHFFMWKAYLLFHYLTLCSKLKMHSFIFKMYFYLRASKIMWSISWRVTRTRPATRSSQSTRCAAIGGRSRSLFQTTGSNRLVRVNILNLIVVCREAFKNW